MNRQLMSVFSEIFRRVVDVEVYGYCLRAENVQCVMIDMEKYKSDCLLIQSIG